MLFITPTPLLFRLRLRLLAGLLVMWGPAAFAQTADDRLFGAEPRAMAPELSSSLRRSRSLDDVDLREGTRNDSADEQVDDTPLFEDFSRYIRETTGKDVADALAAKRFSGRAPKLSDSYVVGSGDEIEVQIWGSLSARYRLTLDDTTHVFVPEVGSINLSGVTAASLSTVITASFKRVYKNFELRALVSRARTMSLYVTGQASSLGLKNVAGTHTVLSAIASFARPGNGGSRRFIELRRKGQAPLRLDVYCMFKADCNELPSALQDGDTLYVPARGKLVALTGAVSKPGIYELAQGEGVAEALAYAGGVSVVADVGDIRLYRFDDVARKERSMRSVALSDLCAGPPPAIAAAPGCGRVIDGDHIDIQPRKGIVQNVVTVTVSGVESIRIELKPGMRLLDVLRPPFETLIPPRTLSTLNAGAYAALNDLDRRLRRLDLENVTLQRLDLSFREYLPQRVDYRAAATAPGSPANLALQAGDVILIEDVSAWKLRRDKQQVNVSLMGEVGRPGRYRFAGARKLGDLIQEAGGLTSDAAIWSAVILRFGDGRSAVSREILDRALKAISEYQFRQEQVNSTNPAAATRVELKSAGDRSQSGSLDIVTGRARDEVAALMAGRDVIYVANRGGRLGSELLLEPDDIVIIPPRMDTFACQGAFLRPGAFGLTDGDMSLGDAVSRCGLIEEMRPNIYHYVARENRVCRPGLLTRCPGVEGGDAIVAVPEVVTKSGTSAFLEWLDGALRVLTTLATVKVLSQ